jgi:hypothetical protein
MNCCTESDKPPVELQRISSQRECRACQGLGRPVKLKTMLLMLKPERFDQVGESQYRFCASPDCEVVYFSSEHHFTTDDLRIRVGLKEKDGPIPLCYCFGFHEQDLRNEIKAEGHTTIPQRISAFIRDGMCACEERNPSGACCFGEVTKTVNRLLEEAR